MTVMVFLSNHGMVRIRLRTSSFFLLRQKDSRSILALCFSKLSMCLRYYLTFTVYFVEVVSTTVACISSI